MIVGAEEVLLAHGADIAGNADYSSLEALHVLKRTSDHMAAITGAQTDRMSRDDGWRLLSIGRQIERLSFLTSSLFGGFETGSVHTDGGFDAMIELFDGTITFRGLYQQNRDIAALIDLLVLDQDSPRSLAWVVQTMRGRLSRLAGSEPGNLSALSLQVPDPSDWSLASLCELRPVNGFATEGEPGSQASAQTSFFYNLNDMLLQCGGAAARVSEEISATYFTHTRNTNQSVGTL